MRILACLASLLLTIAPAHAAVVYKLDINTPIFGGFNGSATVTVPRYLIQPNPPALREYYFAAPQLTACSIAQGQSCIALILGAVPSFTGEYVVTGTIAGSLISWGAIFPTARLDTNGVFQGSFRNGDVLGTLTISGFPDTVPEPAVWMMMIAGLGGVAAVMRRNVARRALAA